MIRKFRQLTLLVPNAVASTGSSASSRKISGRLALSRRQGEVEEVIQVLRVILGHLCSALRRRRRRSWRAGHG